MKNLYIVTAFSAMLLFSCNSDSTEEKTENNSGENSSQTDNCFYQFNNSSVDLSWTAFKFSEKTPVKGSFDNFEITSDISGDDLEALCRNMRIEIQSGSVNSNESDRDKKLEEKFFENMSEEEILAKVVSFDVASKKGEIEITMNGISRKEQAKMILEDQVFSIDLTIDIMNYRVDNSYKALSEACLELHIGADGKSKLWTEVDLHFSGSFASDCD